MPKQVDYASRRRRIAEAVCLLADEQGPEGVSMRDVAARAEVSLALCSAASAPRRRCCSSPSNTSASASWNG
ncbi:hypothetical protein SALBM217S_06374 [Streptomyces griseoloalbus]